MQIEIKRIQRLSGTTTILVTHDQEEALSMADRVAVFNQGRLEQFGTPTEVYDRPALAVRQHVRRNRQCAAGKLVVHRQRRRASLRSMSAATLRDARPAEPLAAGDRVTACVRPEHLRIVRPTAAASPATVEMGLPLGAIIVHEIRTADGRPSRSAQPRVGRDRAAAAPARRCVLRPSRADAVTVFRSS